MKTFSQFREEINLRNLRLQEEIDFLNQQNGPLQESKDPIDQRQYWKNQIVIEYFKKRIDRFKFRFEGSF